MVAPWRFPARPFGRNRPGAHRASTLLAPNERRWSRDTRQHHSSSESNSDSTVGTTCGMTSRARSSIVSVSRGVESLHDEVLHPGVDQRLVIRGDLRRRPNHAAKLLLLVDPVGMARSCFARRPRSGWRQHQPVREMRPENAAGVASYLPAVPIEHAVLASHFVARPHQTRGMSRSKIASVGVTGDEPQRGAFAAAGQDERRSWLLYRRWTTRSRSVL